MKKLNKIIAGSLAILTFASLGAIPALADTSSATSSLVTQISSLLSQVKALQDQISNLNKQKGTLTSQLQSTLKLTRSLTLGMSGDDVKLLQQALAADPSIYPEGITTGYFGKLTEKALKRFQKKHNLEQLGFAGPRTRAAIETWLNSFGTSTAGIPTWLLDRLNHKGGGDNENEASSTGDNNEHKITICHMTGYGGGITISVATQALSAHLAHGDHVGVCGTTATTTPDTAAPVISNLNATSTGSTSGTVSWTTNESANGMLWYSTTTPLNMASSALVSSSALGTGHSFSLFTLTASTTYYVVVTSADASGNTATSSQQSFMTQ